MLQGPHLSLDANLLLLLLPFASWYLQVLQVLWRQQVLPGDQGCWTDAPARSMKGELQ
jgi:hypothetical protein